MSARGYPSGDKRARDLKPPPRALQSPNSLYEALLAAELDDKPACTNCLAFRPKRRLRRFRHRLWVCLCGQAWHTERGLYEAATWLWRRWPA